MSTKGGEWAPKPGKVARRLRVAPPAVHEGEGVLVFAYGSNLRAEQMTARCPSARAVEVARLRGSALSFCGFSRTWGGAIATLVQDPHDSVDGLLYRITPGDLVRLDMFEGAPHVYERHRVEVSGAKMKFHAWVYVHARPRPGSPSYRYFAAIVEGRARLGLGAEPVIRAAETAADVLPF